MAEPTLYERLIAAVRAALAERVAQRGHWAAQGRPPYQDDAEAVRGLCDHVERLEARVARLERISAERGPPGRWR